MWTLHVSNNLIIFNWCFYFKIWFQTDPTILLSTGTSLFINSDHFKYCAVHILINFLQVCKDICTTHFYKWNYCFKELFSSIILYLGSWLFFKRDFLGLLQQKKADLHTLSSLLSVEAKEKWFECSTVTTKIRKDEKEGCIKEKWNLIITCCIYVLHYHTELH